MSSLMLSIILTTRVAMSMTTGAMAAAAAPPAGERATLGRSLVALGWGVSRSEDGRREVDAPEGQALLDGHGVDVDHWGSEDGGAHGEEGEEGGDLNHLEGLKVRLGLLLK